MTRINFYHYASSKLDFACRLAATVVSRDSRLVVYATDLSRLSEFDRRLWSYQSTSFVPHCFAGNSVAAETPVVLVSRPEQLPHHDVLLNLDDAWPPFFASFERLLEIVSVADDDKQLARDRYVFYKRRGYEIHVNAIARH